ncbi:MAG TPA: hypothetical protein VF090_08255 [Methyloceanibacter sp.]
MGPANPSFGNGIERRRCRFSFLPQGASATPYTLAAGTLIGDVGWVSSAARTGVGRYRIVLTTPVIKGFPLFQLGSALVADAFMRVLQVGNEGGPNNFLVDVEAVVAGAVTDLAADNNTRVFCDIEVELANP